MRTSDLTTQPSLTQEMVPIKVARPGLCSEGFHQRSEGRNWATRALCLLLVVLTCPVNSPAYSVLTHEEVVDLLWKDEIRPLLIKRYPGMTDDQIKEAHAYAYGGAVIQDLGYYPFGNKEFSDLAHYVRTGDFVRELLRESNDVNEYAFALGSLAHYSV